MNQVLEQCKGLCRLSALQTGTRQYERKWRLAEACEEKHRAWMQRKQRQETLESLTSSHDRSMSR